MSSAAKLASLLGLKTAPVGVTFCASPPAGLPRVAAPEPSGCTYWKRAAEGKAFYTTAPDHYNCPIGAHTHGVDLPAPQLAELRGVIGTMVGLGYLSSEEVPSIPQRHDEFRVAVYAPVANGAQTPDVVLLVGNAKQMMLLEEAAHAAGAGADAPLMGRPTCAAIPVAIATSRGVASLGCIGNRIYTELADDELYYALPGKHLAAVADKLATIVEANRELEKYHHARRHTIKENGHAS